MKLIAIFILSLSLTACGGGALEVDASGEHPSGAKGEVHIKKDKDEGKE